jgi:membrane protease YdiL (CAAX protease family)
MLLLGRPFLVERVFGIHFPLAFADMALAPLRIQLELMAWQLCATVCFAMALSLAGMRETLFSRDDAGGAAWALLLGACGAVTLNALDIWPFSFRWSGQSTRQYVGNLMELRASAALVLFAAAAAILTPLLEELVFRVGALRLLMRFGGVRFGGLASAALFSLAHVPDLGTAMTPRTVNTLVWTFALGWVLAALVRRANGRITTAIALHMGVNASWVAALLVELASQT